MSKKAWQDKITNACKGVGTYRDEFLSVIETLADNRDKRDKAALQFKKSGGNAVIIHENKNGAKNLVKNPLLVVINDLDTIAMAYMRELGLTPSGLKKISSAIVSNSDGLDLDELLTRLGH